MSDSGWTTGTLFQHFTAVLSERDRALMAALTSMDKRLDGMNEFRQSLNDNRSTFLTRAEALGFLIGCAVIAGAVFAILSYFKVTHP